jgi:hypothetical protein
VKNQGFEKIGFASQSRCVGGYPTRPGLNQSARTSPSHQALDCLPLILTEE